MLSHHSIISVLPNDDHVPGTTPANDRASCTAMWASRITGTTQGQSTEPRDDFAISRCLRFRMTRAVAAEFYPLVRCGTATDTLYTWRPPSGGTGVDVVP